VTYYRQCSPLVGLEPIVSPSEPEFTQDPRGGWNRHQHYTQVVNEIKGGDQAPDTRLAVYGTLRPGRVNHHHISALAGSWTRGTVRGKLFSSGWGAALGFPGLVLDPLGPAVEVDLFESAELAQHWTRLDEFEGAGYQRVVTTISTDEGEKSGWIYVLAEQPREEY
jgi:gamma-glutamylcyclotransferase (GGCT)/AIG2-like uncharacterized protein YtfP